MFPLILLKQLWEFEISNMFLCEIFPEISEVTIINLLWTELKTVLWVHLPCQALITGIFQTEVTRWTTSWWKSMTCGLWLSSEAGLGFFIPPASTKLKGGMLDSPCPSVCLSVCPSICRRHGFQSVTRVCLGISISNFMCMLFVAMARSLLIFSDVTFKWPLGSHIGFFSFRTLTLVWLRISSPNTGTSLVCMGRSLLIFSNVTFKMAAWQPYWISAANPPAGRGYPSRSLIYNF